MVFARHRIDRGIVDIVVLKDPVRATVDEIDPTLRLQTVGQPFGIRDILNELTCDNSCLGGVGKRGIAIAAMIPTSITTGMTSSWEKPRSRSRWPRCIRYLSLGLSPAAPIQLLLSRQLLCFDRPNHGLPVVISMEGLGSIRAI